MHMNDLSTSALGGGGQALTNSDTDADTFHDRSILDDLQQEQEKFKRTIGIDSINRRREYVPNGIRLQRTLPDEVLACRITAPTGEKATTFLKGITPTTEWHRAKEFDTNTFEKKYATHRLRASSFQDFYFTVPISNVPSQERLSLTTAPWGITRDDDPNPDPTTGLGRDSYSPRGDDDSHLMPETTIHIILPDSILKRSHPFAISSEIQDWRTLISQLPQDITIVRHGRFFQEGLFHIFAWEESNQNALDTWIFENLTTVAISLPNEEAWHIGHGWISNTLSQNTAECLATIVDSTTSAEFLRRNIVELQFKRLKRPTNPFWLLKVIYAVTGIRPLGINMQVSNYKACGLGGNKGQSGNAFVLVDATDTDIKKAVRRLNREKTLRMHWYGDRYEQAKVELSNASKHEILTPEEVWTQMDKTATRAAYTTSRRYSSATAIQAKKVQHMEDNLRHYNDEMTQMRDSLTQAAIAGIQKIQEKAEQRIGEVDNKGILQIIQQDTHITVRNIYNITEMLTGVQASLAYLTARMDRAYHQLDIRPPSSKEKADKQKAVMIRTKTTEEWRNEITTMNTGAYASSDEDALQDDNADINSADDSRTRTVSKRDASQSPIRSWPKRSRKQAKLLNVSETKSPTYLIARPRGRHQQGKTRSRQAYSTTNSDAEYA